VFRRWLTLQRDGPDLLEATSLQGEAQAVESGDGDLHRRQTSVLVIPPNDVAPDRGGVPPKLGLDENRQDLSTERRVSPGLDFPRSRGGCPRSEVRGPRHATGGLDGTRPAR
jgi:hypothetical protein